MPDNKYCYPGTDVLVNKLNILDKKELFKAEVKLTSVRLIELQNNPVEGKFDFEHLKSIHAYIFQDLYSWAGCVRTVEIGKGNLFCTTAFIDSFAKSVFDKYYSQCFSAKDDFYEFVFALSENYGDLNALHPFREGNGRAQREFARTLCLKCGYYMDLGCATHQEMLNASVLSFNKGDNSGFVNVFSKALHPIGSRTATQERFRIQILTSDDLKIGCADSYEYYDEGDYKQIEKSNKSYKEKIDKMNQSYYGSYGL